MKINELLNFIDNENDKNIINKMLLDKEETLNTFISSVISDLLNGLLLEDEFKVNANNNIKSYDDISLGEIATFTALIPYVQLALKENKDGYTISTSFVEALISYIVGCIARDEFKKQLIQIKIILNISDKLYEAMIKYFSYQKNDITIKILENTYGA
ncbi:MAG: hypothetical protein ACRDA3_00625 [Peptostreptococcaceae bacterium]